MMMESVVPSIPATSKQTPVIMLPTTVCVIMDSGATELKHVRLPLAAKPERPPTATTALPVLLIPAMKRPTRVTILLIMLHAPTASSATDQRFATQQMAAKMELPPVLTFATRLTMSALNVLLIPTVTMASSATARKRATTVFVRMATMPVQANFASRLVIAASTARTIPIAKTEMFVMAQRRALQDLVWLGRLSIVLMTVSFATAMRFVILSVAARMPMSHAQGRCVTTRGTSASNASSMMIVMTETSAMEVKLALLVNASSDLPPVLPEIFATKQPTLAKHSLVSLLTPARTLAILIPSLAASGETCPAPVRRTLAMPAGTSAVPVAMVVVEVAEMEEEAVGEETVALSVRVTATKIRTAQEVAMVRASSVNLFLPLL